MTRSFHIVVVLVAQSCPTLCNTVDCSPPGSSAHGILQARILEWVAISSSRGSSQPRGWTWVSCIAGRFFTVWATREFHLVFFCFAVTQGCQIILPPSNCFCIFIKNYLTIHLWGCFWTLFYSIVYMYYISEYILVYFLLGFPGGSVVKNLPAIARDSGDRGSTPGSGRPPGGGNGNPLQYPWLGNPMDRGAWRATVHGILQARKLEWVAFPFSRGSSQHRDWTQVSCIAGKFFTNWAIREANN